MQMFDQTEETAKKRMKRLKKEGRQTGGTRTLVSDIMKEENQPELDTRGLPVEEEEVFGGNWQTPPAQLGGSYGHGSKPQLEMQARMNKKDFDIVSGGFSIFDKNGIIKVDVDYGKNKTPDPKIGQLNPNWVEQLMGLPKGWTQLKGCNDFDNRVDRLRLLGNGVIPQVAEKAWITLFDKLNSSKAENSWFPKDDQNG
jgi:hypothetical protein